MNQSPVGASAEQLALHLRLQLIAILLATRLVAAAARRLGQTDDSGEILAGLLLGPSLLGALAPGALAWLFPPLTAPVFTGLLPPSMFTKLVIMAIVSTFIATPLIRRLTRGQQRPPSLYGESAAA